MSAPARRSQEERSAETRARVLQAARESLAERGYRGTTVSEVARRSGVTWGAMQHQFGDKDAILDAVRREGLAELEARVSALGEAEPDPKRRVAAFVAACRELVDGPGYRAFVEVQLARRGEGPGEDAWARQVGRTLSRTFRRAFGDLGFSKPRLERARRFAFVMLSGIAAESMLFPETTRTRSHLETLESTLLRLLELE